MKLSHYLGLTELNCGVILTMFVGICTLIIAKIAKSSLDIQYKSTLQSRCMRTMITVFNYGTGIRTSRKGVNI